MRWKLRIGDVVHGTPRDPFAALDQRRRVNLNNALATHLVPDKSDAAVLAWFWLIPWQSPCLVPFRDKGNEDSRADEPELHAGVAARRPAGGLGLRPGIFPNSEESK
jgi:hypothetical protein